MSAALSDAIYADKDADIVDVGGVGGTLAGNALSLAAARATLEFVLTDHAFEGMIDCATRFADGVNGALEQAGLTWTVSQLGCPRRIPLRRSAAAYRLRVGGGRGHGARRLPARLPRQPRDPDHAVPQHGADVPADDRRGRRPPHGGVHGGRLGAHRLSVFTQLWTLSQLFLRNAPNTLGHDHRATPGDPRCGHRVGGARTGRSSPDARVGQSCVGQDPWARTADGRGRDGSRPAFSRSGKRQPSPSQPGHPEWRLPSRATTTRPRRNSPAPPRPVARPSRPLAAHQTEPALRGGRVVRDPPPAAVAGPAHFRPAIMRTCVRMYVELHAHSAFSFLDGASLAR